MFAGARRAFKRPTGPGASRPTPIKSDRDCPVGPSAPLQSGCPADASAVPSGLVPRLQEVLYRPGPACRRCAAASRPPLEAERLIPRSGAQLSGGAPSLPPRPISRGVFKIAVGPAAPGPPPALPAASCAAAPLSAPGRGQAGGLRPGRVLRSAVPGGGVGRQRRPPVEPPVDSWPWRGAS